MSEKVNEEARKNVEAFLNYLFLKDELQKKYFLKLIKKFSEEEAQTFGALLGYYLSRGESIEGLCDAYLFWINDLREERYYFIQNGRYRYSSAREVEQLFYKNPAYMKKYMTGLAVSTYLLDSHRRCFNFYKEKILSIPNTPPR